MRRNAYLLAIILLLAACTSAVAPPIATVSATPSLTSTVTSAPTSTKLPTATLGSPAASVTPMSVVPISANQWTLNEFNAGTEMKRLNVIGTGTPQDIKFSPDGKLLAVATGRGIYLFDGITFERTNFIDVNDSISAIAFSPDENVLAVAVDGKISLWNVLSGRNIRQLEGGLISIYSLAYGKGGLVAAMGGECRGCGTPIQGMILWDAKTGSQVYAEHDIWYATTALTFTRDGKQLVYGGNRGITTIESNTGKLVSLYSGSKDAHFPDNLVFNTDETQFIISTYFEHEITMIADIAAQKEVQLSYCGLYITRARDIAACSKQKSIIILDGMTAKKINSFEIDIDAEDLREMFALSPNGEFLVYYGKSGIYVLETETGDKIKTLEFTDFTFGQAGLIEIDGVQKYVIATLNSNGQVPIYDLQTRNPLQTIKSDCCAIRSFAFAPNLKTAATVDDRNNFLLWDLQSHTVMYSLILKDYYGGPITFSPDGTGIFYVGSFLGGDAILKLDLQSGKSTYQGENSYPYSYADPFAVDNYHFNKQSNLVVLNYERKGDEYYPSFKDVATEEKIFLPYGTSSDLQFIEAFAISANNKYLAFGSVEGIFVWEDLSQKQLAHLDRHETRSGDGWIGSIKSLIFNPQSNLLVSVGWDGTTRLWNITGGNELRLLNVCCSVSFTPDGRYLVTVGDGVIRVWGIP